MVPPWLRITLPTPWLLGGVAVLLGWRLTGWWLRQALAQAETTPRDVAKALAWDLALGLGIFALGRAGGLMRAVSVQRPGRLAGTGLLVLAAALLVASSVVRAMDTAYSYLAQSHWAADGFLYIDPGWAGRLYDPAAAAMMAVSLALVGVLAWAVVRDAKAVAQPFVASAQPVGGRHVVLALLLTLPAAWAVRDNLLYPPYLFELRLLPEVNVVRQWHLWTQTPPRREAPPHLPPALHRRLVAAGLVPAQPLDPAYPLTRSALGETPLPLLPDAPPRPNVVITLVEGLNSLFVHELSGRHRHVMPELGALVRQMTAVTGFHGTASPTIAGLITTLCGLHPPSHPRDLRPGQTVDGNTAYTCLPDLLRQQGYRTVFVQSTSKDVMGLEFFLRTHGIDEVHARGEFEARWPGRASGPWGMYDEAMVDYTAEQVARLERLRAQDGRPWLLVNLTLETHDPGMAPPACALPPEAEDVPADAAGQKLLAAYHCTDKALGRLGKLLLAPGMRERTLWLLGADHAQFSTVNSRPLLPTVADRWPFGAVPLLIHDPRHALPKRLPVLSGTTDVAPTLLHLLGLDPERHSLTGHSVFGRRAHLPWIVGRVGNRFAYLQTREARTSLATGELRRRCQTGARLLDEGPEPLTACEIAAWLDWQDALWDGHWLFPKVWYQGDKGVDRAGLAAGIERVNTAGEPGKPDGHLPQEPGAVPVAE